MVVVKSNLVSEVPKDTGFGKDTTVKQAQTARFEVGQEVTLLSRGIQHPSYGEPYVSKDEIGRTSFIVVSRVGREYLYGRFIHYEPDGKREERTWETKIKPAEYLILKGIHHQFRELELKHKAAIQAYEEERKKAHYEIERELNEIKWAKQKGWDEAYPRPEPIDLEKMAESARREKNDR